MSEQIKKLHELIETNLNTLTDIERGYYEDPNRCNCPYCEEDEHLYLIWAHEQEEAQKAFLHAQWEEEETTKEKRK